LDDEAVHACPPSAQYRFRKFAHRHKRRLAMAALFAACVVAGIVLLGRWLVRLLAAPGFYEAHRALPWLALGWALYGLVLVLVTIAGRAKVMTRNFPAAAIGVAVNAIVLVALVGPLGIAGAGIALCSAYLVMLAALHALTRRLFAVPFEWGRLALLVGVLAGVSVTGELALPTSGATGFLTRAAALAAIPVLLLATGFFRANELQRVRSLARRARNGASPSSRAGRVPRQP
jgi:O-antigen/teichoic acid export membrane protein